MTMSIALASIFLLAGCATVADPPAPQRLPYIAIFKPPPAGQEDIFLLAGLTSQIWIDDDCVLIGNGQAGYSLPLFYRSTTVGRDSHGIYLRDGESGIRFRDGDRVKGGGGSRSFVGRELDRSLLQPVPDACLDRVKGSAGSVNPGLQRG